MHLDVVIGSFPRRMLCPDELPLERWIHSLKHRGTLDLRYDYDVTDDLGNPLDMSKRAAQNGLRAESRIFISRKPGEAA